MARGKSVTLEQSQAQQNVNVCKMFRILFIIILWLFWYYIVIIFKLAAWKEKKKINQFISQDLQVPRGLPLSLQTILSVLRK